MVLIPARIAEYDDRKVAALLADAGIVRNRAKVAATIQNAKAYLLLTGDGQSFSNFYGISLMTPRFRINGRQWPRYPPRATRSEAMSKALGRAGFKFVGATICYAFMQSTGMVNDHLTTCPRHGEVQASFRR
ncbi:DNA-3-methyladenine glycosylase I [Candidatus Accumulibacter sp. ACC012]|uniref:DNA-3-methyladenine glycosylase I n=1 Tax=Candidatus Accumulibacter sp. ACC012 TaxID=2823332 RepID=UPI0025BD6DBF|nr:DNA-3-methyladenine glycosylase I [Candidatus Accumulibacter sp. ACC012]